MNDLGGKAFPAFFGRIMNNCSWCNLTDEDRKYLLYEDQYWSVYLADEQDYVGRCIVVARRHCASLAELNDTEWDDLRKVIRIVEDCLKSALGADLCNWSCLMNDCFKEQEPNPHVHLHCRPRYKNPLTINGNVYADEEFGHHYMPHKQSQLSDADRESLFNKMKDDMHGRRAD